MKDLHIIRRWISATVGGVFLGAIVQSFVPILMPERPVMALYPLGLTLGLTFGALQALVLRHHISRAWTWAVATGVGVAVAEVVAGFILHDTMGLEFGFYRSPLPEALTALAVVGVTLGVCVGGAQWLVLYQAGYRALSWMPVTVVGFTVAIGLGDSLAIPEALLLTLIGLLAGYILGSGLYGLLTGLLLKRLISSQAAPVGQL